MIVVTGGAGFIGSVLVGKLNDEGYEDILIVDNLREGSNKWKNLVGKKFIDYLNKDRFIEAFLKGEIDAPATAVIHLGACSSTTETDTNYLISNNYEYTKSLASHCIENGIRFIYASSAATYGDGSQGFSDNLELIGNFRPLNPYAFSKQLFDQWAFRTGALSKILGLKFFNVYGPNEYHKNDMKSVVCKAAEQIHKDGSLKLFKSHKKGIEHGEQKRDFIYVEDCAELMIQALDDQFFTGLYNLGTGEAKSFNDLAKAVFKALGKPVNIEYIDMPESIRDKYQYFTAADMSNLLSAKEDYEFTSLEDGVTSYVTNYLASPEVRYL